LRDGAPTGVHFVVPECNSLGLAMLGGRSLADAFAAIDQSKADTVVVLENDLYRRAEKDRVDRFLAVAKQVVVIDHLLHEIAKKAQMVLPAATFAETEGTMVSSEGRAQRFFTVFPPAGDCQASWRWLADAGRKTWRTVDELTRDCAEALPVFKPIVQAAPGSEFRIAGQKIPRQPNRYSGRTAILSNLRIHEPKQPTDPDSALAFSMEGAQSAPPSLNPFVWAPGWNSNQAVSKFQDEIGGALRGGDPGVRLIEPKSGEALPWFAPPSVPTAGAGRLRLTPLHHVFGSEELSMFSAPLAERAPEPYLALNPEDATERGLSAGDHVPVALGGTEYVLQVLILPGLARGLAGIPFGFPELPWFDTATAFWEHKPDSAEKT
jgi:NADH-quinone oxidoreductase subunit G